MAETVYKKEDNNQMDLKEIAYGCVKWIELA
jgi:hypothetical protein